MHPRNLIAIKIAEGGLPWDTHESASLRHGGGDCCDGCDEPVLASSIEVGVVFTRAAPLRFHLDCFGIWRFAARQAIGARVARDRDGGGSNDRVRTVPAARQTT
jgi:hypothetical protein